MCYGELNRHLPWQLQRLFKIKLQNEEGAFTEYWLALALATIPENSGNLDLVTKFIQVRKAPAGVALQVLSLGHIVGCAHVTPEIATSSGTGDGRNEQWIVNSHIDLATWNDVYNWTRENCILHPDRRNANRDILSVTHRIAIPMQAHTQRTPCDVLSLLTRTQE